MSTVYRKVSNIFQRSNHDQHDIMDHDHDHETTTGPIKVDNQTIFTQEFAKRPTQIYKGMVDVLKQLKDTKRVNEALKNEFHERKNHDKKRAFTPISFNTTLQRTPKFSDPENMEEFVKSLNRSNMFFVLNSEPTMTGIPQKT